MKATKKLAKSSVRAESKRSLRKQPLKKASTSASGGVHEVNVIGSLPKPKSKSKSSVVVVRQKKSSRPKKQQAVRVRARGSQRPALLPPDRRLDEFQSTLTTRVEEWVSGMSDGERAQELVASASSGRGLTAVDIRDALKSASPLGVQLTRDIYEATHRTALDLVLNKTLGGGGSRRGNGGS